MSSIAVPPPRAATGGPTGAAPRPPGGLIRLVALVFWLVVPVLAVVGVVRGIVTWTDHAHQQLPGVPGVFLVENRSCSGSICQSTGTFTSTGGTLVVTDITGGLGWEQDSRHAVVFDPSTPSIIVPLPTRWNPTAAITTVAGSTALLAAWTWLAVGARRPTGVAPATGPAAGGAPALA